MKIPPNAGNDSPEHLPEMMRLETVIAFELLGETLSNGALLSTSKLYPTEPLGRTGEKNRTLEADVPAVETTWKATTVEVPKETETRDEEDGKFLTSNSTIVPPDAGMTLGSTLITVGALGSMTTTVVLTDTMGNCVLVTWILRL